MNGIAGLVAPSNGEDVLVERCRYRDGQKLSGLARRQLDLVAIQIDLAPSERGQISEALSGVEPEFDEALPFGIRLFQHDPQLIERERSALKPFAILN